MGASATPGEVTSGSVVQINHEFGRAGWVGAFVLVSEVRSWGVLGYVHHITTHARHGEVWIRLKWSEFDYIGQAVLVPKSRREEHEDHDA